MTFYFDNCLSKNIAKALRCLGVDVLVPEDIFNDDSVDDKVWMPYASKQHWVILTSDKRIRKNPGEREIFESLEAVTFFLYEKYVNQPLFQQAAYIFKHWEHISKKASHVKLGTSYRMAENGEIVESGQYEQKRAKQRAKRKRRSTH